MPRRHLERVRLPEEPRQSTGRIRCPRLGEEAIDCDDLEAIEETLEILSDPDLVKEVEAGRVAISTGDIVSPDDLKALRERLRSATNGPA
jgi:hypothetical protein